MKNFLFCFPYTLQSFRLSEFIALADLQGVEYEYDEEEAKTLNTSVDTEGRALLAIKLKSREDAIKVAKRAILLKNVYELWGEGNSYEELIANLTALPDQKQLKDISWKMNFLSFGRGYLREEQLEKMHSLKGIPFLEEGKVQMKNPDKILCLIEDVGILSKSEPRKIYFGETLCEGNRDLIFKYNLKKRPFLGTTSMDPELSLISANMAKARPGTLIYDPFVGTGSLMLACAHFGAHVVGADIDIRTVRNPNPKMRVEANFAAHGLSSFYTDIFLGDNSRTPLRSAPLFDAIVTDPPYGIRAGARKVGKKNKKKYKAVPVGFHQEHFPQCIGYKVSDVMKDLLSLAARMLKVGGRLVYWLPTPTDYKPTDLPLHPCLKEVAHGVQVMSSLWARRLITMEKYREYSPDLDNLDASHYGQLTATHDKLRELIFFSNPKSKERSDQEKREGKRGGKEREGGVPSVAGLNIDDDDSDDDDDDEDEEDENENVVVAVGENKSNESGQNKT